MNVKSFFSEQESVCVTDSVLLLHALCTKPTLQTHWMRNVAELGVQPCRRQRPPPSTVENRTTPECSLFPFHSHPIERLQV